jgi:excisionase family DNA binding protein
MITTTTHRANVASAYVDAEELARILGVTKVTISGWQEKHGLPAYAITTHSVRFHLDEVDAWLRAKRVNDKDIPASPLGRTPPHITLVGLTVGQEIEVFVDGVAAAVVRGVA